MKSCQTTVETVNKDMQNDNKEMQDNNRINTKITRPTNNHWVTENQHYEIKHNCEIDTK